LIEGKARETTIGDLWHTAYLDWSFIDTMDIRRSPFHLLSKPEYDIIPPE